MLPLLLLPKFLRLCLLIWPLLLPSSVVLPPLHPLVLLPSLPPSPQSLPPLLLALLLRMSLLLLLKKGRRFRRPSALAPIEIRRCHHRRHVCIHIDCPFLLLLMPSRVARVLLLVPPLVLLPLLFQLTSLLIPTLLLPPPPLPPSLPSPLLPLLPPPSPSPPTLPSPLFLPPSLLLMPPSLLRMILPFHMEPSPQVVEEWME
jgi:hypothetical protein